MSVKMKTLTIDGITYEVIDEQARQTIEVIKQSGVGQPGTNGKDGVSATHSWNGTTLTITSASGTSSANLKGEKGDTGATGSAGKDGTSVTVKSVSESTADGGSNVVTFSDGKTLTIKNGSKGSKGDTGATGATGPTGATGAAGAAGKDGKSAYQYATEAGFEGTEAEFAEKLASSSGYPYATVMDYGAKGNGTADDTVAFQTALAENRVVFVPGGTYKLSGTLMIRENCCLELSQDTTLNFTQTDKNCINMQRSANLRGNHATIFVPYTFGANVIHPSTDIEDGNATDVPPWTAWDPQWKMTRYITDINICKPNSWSGRCNSLDGAVYGTAVDVYCERDTYNSLGNGLEQPFMWGVVISGLRIAGGFVYGLRLRNKGTAWNHDSRIEAVIYGCETAVSVENCHFVHLAVAVQPAMAQRVVNGNVVETAYAKNGIKLVDSHNVDLSQSYVWDWQYARKDSSEYTHIAMYGNCYGVVLNEPRYYESSTDVRDSIYTDTPSNLDKMTILQEPITRWFKTIEGKPYFYDGTDDIPLMARDEIQEYFTVDRVANFTDLLATAKDTDKTTVYNGIGYKKGTRVVISSGEVITDSNTSGYVATGFIPVKAGDVIYISGAHFNTHTGWPGIVYFDENLNRIWSATSGVLMVDGPSYTGSYWQKGERTADGVKITTSNVFYAETGKHLAYVRFTFAAGDFGDGVAISVNNEIKWEQAGFLADGIKVKGENIIGNAVLTSPNGTRFVLTVSDNGTLSATATT